MRPCRSLSELPSIVRITLLQYQAFLVGSACKFLLDSTQPVPKDFDLLVNPLQFQDACKLLTGLPVAINSFGGIKCLGTPSIDLIPLSLADFIEQCDGRMAIKLHPFIVIEWQK